VQRCYTAAKPRIIQALLFLLLTYLTQAFGQTSKQDVPTKATELVRSGNALYDNGKYDEAVKEYEAAIALAPRWFEPHYELGQTYYQMKRSEDAQKQYELALKADPDCWVCYQGLGNLADDAGDRSLAIQHFQQAADLAPDKGQPRYNLAITYLRMQKSNEAISALLEAEALQPSYASPYFLLGKIYFGQKKFYLAFDQLFQATKLEKSGARFDKAKELIDAHVIVDEKLDKSSMGSHMSYCIARSAAMTIENYRKRFPGAETYVENLAEEEYVLSSFVAMVEENPREMKQGSEFGYLVAIKKAGFLAPFILVTSAERFAKDSEEYEKKNPGRVDEFKEWAAHNKIQLQPFHPRCEVSWMGQTW